MIPKHKLLEQKKTQVAVLHKLFQVKIEEREIQDLKPCDVLVKVMAVGVCGSDVHYYESGKIGTKKVEQPFIQGHECSGIVIRIGEEVTNVKPGDRVAIEPGVSCSQCEFCKEGRYNLCDSIRFLSSPPTDGALSEYITHPSNLLFPIPDQLSFEEATLVEPLSVGLHALKRADIKPGSSILITGMGPIGLTAVIAAKIYGAKKIIVTDIEPYRLEVAKQLGATHAINVTEHNLKDIITQVTNQCGVDVIIETSGQSHAIDSTLELIKKGGKIAFIGYSRPDYVPVNFYLLLQKEIDLYGVFRYANTYQHAIDILASKQFSTQLLLTDFYPLKETHQALERARNNKKTSIKVIIYPNGDPKGINRWEIN